MIYNLSSWISRKCKNKRNYYTNLGGEWEDVINKQSILDTIKQVE